MICVVSSGGSCPSGDDWSTAVVWLTLIVAIATYNGWKVWLRHRYPEDKK
jgi:hypothetical protein